LAASTSWPGGALEVHAQELLLLPDHAQLDRGRERRVAVEGGAHRRLPASALSSARRLVVADHRKQRRPPAEGVDVARHVAAPPGVLDPAHEHDRHGRSGEMRSTVAEPVAVEHHVATTRTRQPRNPARCRVHAAPIAEVLEAERAHGQPARRGCGRRR